MSSNNSNRRKKSKERNEIVLNVHYIGIDNVHPLQSQKFSLKKCVNTHE